MDWFRRNDWLELDISRQIAERLNIPVLITMINEAFGAQTSACAKDLNLDINELNVDGGAIALGHPLGASETRITVHLIHKLRLQLLFYQWPIYDYHL
ncbi:hypothetical protein HCN44_001784 [Aphidius gifuensis]|uniref:Thiolase C-terminal domain-containing protein n=1 Tax=Aphidius gifuensis TaxID=684658 RepID=A0A835CQ28_APHGI|nr:hypothetical protein HCN44_001784 [Aphidius gifuensis]